MTSCSDSLTRECPFFLKKETKSNHPIILYLFELTLTNADLFRLKTRESSTNPKNDHLVLERS